MKILGKKAIEIFNSEENDCLRDMRSYVDQGGDKTIVDDWQGWTLLHFSCECLQVETLKYLISVGLDFEIEDKQGWRPIHLAVDSDIDSAIQTGEIITFSCTKVLVKAGASIEARNSSGETPRDIAAAYGEKILAAFDEAVKDRNV